MAPRLATRGALLIIRKSTNFRGNGQMLELGWGGVGGVPKC